MAAYDVLPVPTPGLGNTTYLVASDGEAVAIDPPRDAWRLSAAAEEHGWRLIASLETHVHNDYLSGARELRRSNGARIVAPEAGAYRFSHRGVSDGDEMPVGQVALVARATPGHTPEHLAWELRDGSGDPRALFSGGSLLMNGVGRTDLLGPDRTQELTDAQFATLVGLRRLPDEVVVYPTHGAGSFCVMGDGERPPSATIGSLRRWNEAFAAADLPAFKASIAAGRTRFPAYYSRVAPLNRRGPKLVGAPPRVPDLAAADVERLRIDGVPLVDIRDRRSFAAAHIAGALNVEPEAPLAAYVGWLLPFDSPLILVADSREEAASASVELLRIGYDRVLGWLAGGIGAWSDAGFETRSFELVTPDDVRGQVTGDDPGPSRILDVRQPSEWRTGAIPGSRLVFVADLSGELGHLDHATTWTVICRTGSRASIAASLLDAAGIPVRSVATGGIPSLPTALLEPA